MNFIQILYLIVTVPIGILITRIKEIKTGKRVPYIFTELENSIRSNGNRMYYVVRKYNNNKDQVLTQYIDFYLPIQNNFKNVTIDIADYINLRDRFQKLSLRKGKTYGTLVMKDLDIFILSNMINDKFNKRVDLLRIDEEVVNC